MNKQKQGMLIVLSAPSGGGKSTLCKMMLEKHSNIKYSISYTTRPRRGDEKNGVHYNFVTEQQFLEMEENGDFIESAKVHANYYGTSIKLIQSHLEEGYDVILDIDVQGAKLLMDRGVKATYIFIVTPKISDLRERLEGRSTDSKTQVDLRIENAKKELSLFKLYDYVVVNDSLEKAFSIIEKIYCISSYSCDRIKDIKELVEFNE